MFAMSTRLQQLCAIWVIADETALENSPHDPRDSTAAAVQELQFCHAAKSRLASIRARSRCRL